MKNYPEKYHAMIKDLKQCFKEKNTWHIKYYTVDNKQIAVKFYNTYILIARINGYSLASGEQNTQKNFITYLIDNMENFNI